MLITRHGAIFIHPALKELLVVTDRALTPPPFPYTARLRIKDLGDNSDRLVVIDKFKGSRDALNTDAVKKELHADSILVLTGVIDLGDC